MNEIKNESQFRQKALFEGLVYGSGAKPTDIDFLLTITNKLVVIGEIKHDRFWVWGTISNAQKWAFDEIINGYGGGQRTAVAFFARHFVDAPDDFYVKDCQIVEYRISGHDWQKPNKIVTVEKFLDTIVPKFSGKQKVERNI